VKTIVEVEKELEERVRAIVVAEKAKLRACYERGLERDPGLVGRVVLVLEVGQSGTATHVFEARREGLGEEEVKCFAHVLKAAHVTTVRRVRCGSRYPSRSPPKAQRAR